jgi:hypothetical protein
LSWFGYLVIGFQIYGIIGFLTGFFIDKLLKIQYLFNPEPLAQTDHRHYTWESTVKAYSSIGLESYHESYSPRRRLRGVSYEPEARAGFEPVNAYAKYNRRDIL